MMIINHSEWNQNMAPNRSLAYILTISGLTPFIGLLIASILLKNMPTLSHTLLAAELAYGAIIVSFIAGSQWGTAIQSRHQLPFQLILSNLIALIAWTTLVLHHLPIGFYALAIALLYLLWCDLNQITIKSLPTWYRPLRIGVTLFAVACLLTSALFTVGQP